MPLLNLNGQMINDNAWQYLRDGDAVTTENLSGTIIPLKKFNETDIDPSAMRAILLEGDDDVTGLKDYLADLTLIVVTFVSFSDGRGFSQSHWLRRHGFRGTLRAKGWLLPDQLRHLTQCGFDMIDVDDAIYQRHQPDSWQNALLVKPSYQKSYAGDFLSASAMRHRT